MPALASVSVAAPDILWIVTTQWRAQACGFVGDVNARTPVIDALASQSLHYTQAVTPHPFGPFARAALLTGVHSPDNGVRDYWDPLPRSARTVAHALGERGYATAFFGKWGVGDRDRSALLVSEAAARVPVPREARGGFAWWCGFEGGFQLNDPWLHGDGLDEFRASEFRADQSRADQPRAGERRAGEPRVGESLAGELQVSGSGPRASAASPDEVPVRRRGYQSDVLADLAAAWWERRAAAGRARPLFALVSLEAPHPPYGAPTPPGTPRPAAEEIALPANVPRGGEVETRARRELAGYYAHIAATDAAIGALLARVNQDVAARGGRPPVVVFTSVHGDMHGAHGLFRKGWPHEESIRVPLLVRGAPGAPAGGHSEEPVSLVDLPAMALAWSEGSAWTCPRDRAEISMPSVVALPDQCDRVWRGWRSAGAKEVQNADGTLWALSERLG